MNTSTIYLSIGTNLGDKETNVQTCLQLLEKRVGQLTRCSSLYYSAPQDFISTNDFINLVVQMKTTLSPIELLHTTQAIEREMGRTQKSEWQTANGESRIIHFDRIIDIDILYYDDLSTIFYDDKGNEVLILPHPHMHERDFVMVPLREIFAGKSK